MVGGLSFGGGAMAGAILGAASAMSLRRGYQFVRSEQTPEARWAIEFLDQLLRQSMLRYIAVAHFGRGRGEWRETGNPERWNALVGSALRSQSDRFAAVVGTARGRASDNAPEAAALAQMVAVVLADVLSTAYPQAAH